MDKLLLAILLFLEKQHKYNETIRILLNALKGNETEFNTIWYLIETQPFEPGCNRSYTRTKGLEIRK